jgi:hypothetical protein
LRNYLERPGSTQVKVEDDSLLSVHKKLLHSKVSELNALIVDIQSGMVVQSERAPGNKIRQTDGGTEVMYKYLSNPFTPWPVKTFLLPGTSTRNELETALNDFRDLLPELVSEDVAAKYSALIDPDVYLPSSQQEMSMMSGLHALDIMRNSILVAEKALLKRMTEEESKKVLAER